MSTRRVHAWRGPGSSPPATPGIRTNNSPRDALRTIGIDVEGLAVPDDPLGLDLRLFRIEVAMAVDRHLGSNRNHVFLETRGCRARAWRQREIPDLALIVAYFHRRVRSGETYARLDRTREFEFLIRVPGPTVMGCSRKRQKRKRENAHRSPERES